MGEVVGALVGAAVGAGVDEIVPLDCDGESSTTPANPDDAAESFADSDTVEVEASEAFMPSPCHVEVGPVPSAHPEGLVHVTLLFVSGRLSANASSFDCAGASDGVVNDVLLLTKLFPDLSTDEAVESAAIQTCSRAAESGLKT